MRAVKLGIIGCGVISHTYISDLKRLYQNDLEIMAVSDADESRARSVAEQYGIPRACSVAEMLDDPGIELVLNITPPAAHTQINLLILAAGKHLFCEKPFALSLEDAQKVAAIAKEKGLLIGSAPDSFLGSALSTCRKLINDHWIGKPLYVTLNMMTCGVESWHPHPEHYYLWGGGPMFDMGGYYFSALVDMLGGVDTIYAVSGKGFEERILYSPQRLGEKIPVEVPTHYSAVITMKSGVIVSANFSFDIWKTNLPMFEIYGTDGTLMVPDPNMHGGVPKVYRKEQTIAPFLGGVDNGGGEPFAVPELSQNIGTYVRCLGVADMAGAIREKRRPRVNAEFAIHVLEIVIGVMKSAESGQVYKMSTCYETE